MRYLLGFLLLFLLLSSNAGAMQIFRGGTVSGGPCDILSYGAESYSDGTNLTSAGWTGSDSNEIEISTTMAATGTNSIHITNTASSTVKVVKTFTAQSSIFTFSFEIAYTGTSHRDYFMNVLLGTTEIIYIQNYDYTLKVNDTTTATPLTASTFYTISIEINPATDTFSVKIDDTEVLTDRPFGNAVASVDTITLTSYNDVGGTASEYIDDMCVTSGGW